MGSYPNGEFPIYSSGGAARYPGRWHVVETPVIYASEHYSTAMLDMLASSGELPPNQGFQLMDASVSQGFTRQSKPAAPSVPRPSSVDDVTAVETTRSIAMNGLLDTYA